MKKTIAALCALLLVCCLAVSACAEERVSNLYGPNPSETLKALLGGKSFDARIAGYASTGEDEDAKFTVTVTVCERDRFAPEAIENLAVHDILTFGDGTSIMVMEATPDEYGVTVKDGFGNGYCFFKAEDGEAYIATTETEYPLWTEIFTIKVPLAKDISFLDWSDPENLTAPVQLGFGELLDHLLNNTDFTPNNTRLTFDADGKLVEFLYSYSPWN